MGEKNLLALTIVKVLPYRDQLKFARIADASYHKHSEKLATILSHDKLPEYWAIIRFMEEPQTPNVYDVLIAKHQTSGCKDKYSVTCVGLHSEEPITPPYDKSASLFAEIAMLHSRLADAYGKLACIHDQQA
jgi:hypothetical protein